MIASTNTKITLLCKASSIYISLLSHSFAFAFAFAFAVAGTGTISPS
jgi:hypothetical protein